MNPTVFAMRRPVTTLMLVVALISGGLLGHQPDRGWISSPSLNVPKIYVFLDYIGMSPDQMEGFIVNELRELYFQYVDGIKDIDTRNIQQVALCESLCFLSGTDMGQAMAQVVAIAGPGDVVDAQGDIAADDHAGWTRRASRSDTPRERKARSPRWGRWTTLPQSIIRPLGAKTSRARWRSSPFGPNMRSIVVLNVDPKQAPQGLQPECRSKVIDALATGNTVIPAGNVYIKDSMPLVANNATVVDIQKLGDIPLRLERNVYLRDVATIQDYVDITYGYALVNGKNSVYLPIIKRRHRIDADRVADVHQVDAIVPPRLSPRTYRSSLSSTSRRP